MHLNGVDDAEWRGVEWPDFLQALRDLAARRPPRGHDARARVVSAWEPPLSAKHGAARQARRAELAQLRQTHRDNRGVVAFPPGAKKRKPPGEPEPVPAPAPAPAPTPSPVTKSGGRGMFSLGSKLFGKKAGSEAAAAAAGPAAAAAAAVLAMWDGAPAAAEQLQLQQHELEQQLPSSPELRALEEKLAVFTEKTAQGYAVELTVHRDVRRAASPAASPRPPPQHAGATPHAMPPRPQHATSRATAAPPTPTPHLPSARLLPARDR